jgi:hypothetical protein
MHSVPESSQVDVVIVRAANNKALCAAFLLTLNLNYLDAVDHTLVRLNKPERDDQVGVVVLLELETCEVPALHAACCVSRYNVIIVVSSSDGSEGVKFVMISIEDVDRLLCTCHVEVPEANELVSRY